MTVETLFLSLPRLTDVTDEEWIKKEAFRDFDELHLFDGRATDAADVSVASGHLQMIPLFSPDSSLPSCQSLNIKSKAHLTEEELKGGGGEFRDQGDAKWIVISNDRPCGRQGPGRPIGLIGVFY
jgi:hypothetical protein